MGGPPAPGGRGGGGPPVAVGRGAPAGRGGGRGRGNRGGAKPKGPQPTKDAVKLNKKVKAFGWKRCLLEPEKMPNIIWRRVKEPDGEEIP